MAIAPSVLARGALTYAREVAEVKPAMIVVYIERWSGFDRREQYPWSVWDDGQRLDMGGPFASPDEAETDARAYCRRTLGREPGRVLRL